MVTLTDQQGISREMSPVLESGAQHSKNPREQFLKFMEERYSQEAFTQAYTDIQGIENQAEALAGQVKKIFAFCGIDLDTHPHFAAEFLDVEAFNLSDPKQDIQKVSETTRLHVAELYASMNYGKDLSKSLKNDSLDRNTSPEARESIASRKQAAIHIGHVLRLAKDTSKMVNNIQEKVLLILGSLVHDAGKTDLALPHGNHLTEKEKVGIGGHTDGENSWIRLIQSQVLRFFAEAHHSMTPESIARLQSQGHDIRQLSHNEVREMAKELNMPEDLVMRALIEIKIVDAWDGAMATDESRPYRQTANSGIHGLFEVLSGLRGIDPDSKYKSFIIDQLAWVFDMAENYAHITKRTPKDFDQRVLLEDRLATEKFQMSRTDLEKRLLDANKDDLQALIQSTGEMVNTPDNLDGLRIQMATILNKMGIFTQSKSDPRLLTASDFFTAIHLPKTILEKFHKLSYRQIFTFLQRIEPRILGERRHEQHSLLLTHKEEKEMQSVLAEYSGISPVSTTENSNENSEERVIPSLPSDLTEKVDDLIRRLQEHSQTHVLALAA